MAHYLIAGASGYVGSRLAARLLARGHRVRGIVRNPDCEIAEELAYQGMCVWTGDLTRPESLVGVADGVDYVLNLTSCLAIESNTVRRTYVDGNQHLIAACSRSRSVQSYLFTSSVAPYGSVGDAWVGEDHPVAPTAPLGAVLAEAERAIMALARAHRFPAIVLRVASIYGPGRDPVEAVEGGVATLYGDGRNFVSHIHVDDLLEILERVPVEGEPGAIYNVGDEEPTRLLDLYAAIRERLGMVPPRSFSAQAALAAGLDPSVVAVLTASVRLDTSRLRHDLDLGLRYPSVYAWLDERLPVEELVAV